MGKHIHVWAARTEVLIAHENTQKFFSGIGFQQQSQIDGKKKEEKKKCFYFLRSPMEKAKEKKKKERKKRMQRIIRGMQRVSGGSGVPDNADNASCPRGF